MSKLRFSVAQKKDDDNFDEFIDNFFDAMTSVQDPGDADDTLSDLTTKFNNLLASMRESGLIK